LPALKDLRTCLFASPPCPESRFVFNIKEREEKFFALFAFSAVKFPNTQMQYYVLVNEEQQGPFSESQIKGYIAMGQFQPTDLAWHEGLPEWKPLQDFPPFAPKIQGHRTPNYQSVPVRNLAPKKKKKGGMIMSAALCLIVFAAAGVGGYYGYNYWQAHKQKSGADAANGSTTNAVAADPTEPKTLEELNRWYEEPPAGQNAATFFQQGFDALQITNADKNSYSLPLIGKAQMPAITAPVPTGMKTTITAFLDKNKAAMDLFERGAQLNSSMYSVDLTKGSEALLPHVAKVKQVGQMAELEAMMQADSHQGVAAAKAVSLALASARTLKSEPLLISQLTRVAGESSAEEALEQTLNRVAVPADSLNQLQSSFDAAADYEAAGTGFNRALVGERVNGATILVSSPDKTRQTTNNNPYAATVGGNVKEQQQFFEDSINQVLAARKEPLPSRLKANDVLTPRVEEAKSKGYSLLLATLPALSKVTTREAIGLAHLRLAQIAIALEKLRAANSKYPDALTELVPKFLSAVPADPFDGQPLRYRKVGEGFVIYSVGPDLKDDSGMRRAGSDDLSFIVVKPAK
jgi:hypothetical protein